MLSRAKQKKFRKKNIFIFFEMADVNGTGYQASFYLNAENQFSYQNKQFSCCYCFVFFFPSATANTNNGNFVERAAAAAAIAVAVSNKKKNTRRT